MVWRKHGDDPMCPCCEHDEDTDRILQSCASALQNKIFTTEREACSEYLKNTTTWEIHEIREIRGAILELLTSFRENREPVIHHNWSTTTSTMVMSQFELGQRAFVSGLWIEDWISAQSEHHKTLNTRKHGLTAIVQMITKLQKLTRELWYYSRNDALHQNTQSRINKDRSIECDAKIASLLQRKRTIPSRLLAPADRK